MKHATSMLNLLSIVLLMACSNEVSENQQAEEKTSFEVPVEYYKLDNGLKVVLSPDGTAPTVIVAVYYNIGFRLEPKNRTGFAHLFEHMMFQGSKNLEKGEFVSLVQDNGGLLNGSTRFDFTNYFEIVPAHKLETMLWAEADRMKGLNITQANLTNQQGVVKNEVKVNVLNQPYGGFPWLDMPQYANENWYNAHNFYGDLEDLDAATLEDVESFFNTYYAPNNAAIAVTGDFDTEEAKAWILQYFGAIPASDLPAKPDISEPVQQEEKRFEKEDPLAPKPAIAIAYDMPKKNSPEYYAMGILDQILLQGESSLFHKKLIKEKGYAANVSGGINYLLGNMYNYNGPMQWMFELTHDNDVAADSIISSVDEVLATIREKGVDQLMLDKALVQIRSQFYSTLGETFGVGTADLLCSFALFDDDPTRVNRIEEEFQKVTPELINQTIDNYLRNTNRTILTVKPGAAETAGM